VPLNFNLKAGFEVEEEKTGKKLAEILVVEDEGPVRELLKMYLEREGYRVEEAGNGEEGLKKALKGTPDLIILDIMLPGLDGWTVCREIRKKSQVPIIMLTAKGEESDKILGLEMGADDYITKPFSPREVVARVKAVLKRVLKSNLSQEELVLGDLYLSESSGEVRVGGSALHLTPKEFDLLLLFARNPPQDFQQGRAFEVHMELRLFWRSENR